MSRSTASVSEAEGTPEPVLEPAESQCNQSRRSWAMDSALVAVLIAVSASVGWLLGRGNDEPWVIVEASYDPAGAAATADSEELGRMKAELLRLRVLFQRLAEVAEIDHGGEFDVDFKSDASTGDGEPLSRLDPASPDALEVLFSRLDPMIHQVETLQSIYYDRRREYDLRLSGRPLAGGKISSGFGTRADPLSGRRVMHKGLDFVAPVGEPILALADGVVTWAGTNGGYGLLVELEHADGFRTRYAHNEAILVERGSRVRKGEAVATLGSSGRSTGPHLHLEVHHRGEPIDPRYVVR